VVVPDPGYLKEVRRLCDKHNVLMVCDEVQTGLGRTGKMMGYDHEGVKPDILTLGKALSGGMMPISGVVCNDDLMMLIQPGDYGSTFAYNPLACAIAKEAVQVIVEEGLTERAAQLGDVFREELETVKSPLIKERRGKGLLRAIELVRDAHVDGGDLTEEMRKVGFLARATHQYNVRMAPALIITKEEIKKGTDLVKEAIKNLEKVSSERLKTQMHA